MFMGEFTPKLDDKGRFFLPTRFRDELKEGMAMVRQPEHCIALWPAKTFVDTVAAPALGRPRDRANRHYQRMTGSNPVVEVDGQGRVLVPPRLREYAGLDKEIVVIGALDHVEVWDAQAWDNYLAVQEEEYANLDEKEGAPATTA